MVDPIPLRGTSLHDDVAARLRAMVFERELKPGDYIDEKALAARWQISRTPLREALKVLAAEGLVELVPRRGCRVIEMTDADADALFPVMALLEGRCAYEAVRKAERRRRRRAASACTTSSSATPPRTTSTATTAPTTPSTAACRRWRDNRWLDRATGDLRKFVRLLRGRQLALPGRIDASINEHRVLIDAIEQRDAVRAERAMHDHLMAQLAALKALQQLEAEARGTSAQGRTPCWLN